MSKPRSLIGGKAPFYAMEKGDIHHCSTHTLQLKMVIPISKVADTSAVSLAVIKQLLNRTVPRQLEVGTDGPASAAATDDDPPSSVVVDIISITPLADTIRHVPGKLDFSICVVAKVRAAMVTMGVLVGVTVAPFVGDTYRVRVADEVEVLCRFSPQDPIGEGQTVLVAIEPNLIRCLTVKFSRPSPGTWKREIGAAGRLDMLFEFDPALAAREKSGPKRRLREEETAGETETGGFLETADDSTQNLTTSVSSLPSTTAIRATSSRSTASFPQRDVAASGSDKQKHLTPNLNQPPSKLKGPSQSLKATGTKIILDASDSDAE